MTSYSEERFLELIRSTKSSELDSVSQPIVQKVYQSYDCASCGRCCSALNPPFTPEDSIKMANRLAIKTEKFELDFLADVGNEHMKVMNCTPCAFLEGTLCKVYESRPDSCADYPHLHHRGIKYRIRSVLKNKSVCPMVEEWVTTVFDQLLK